MEKRPQLAVVLPFYNREKLLDRAIRSIKEQTVTDFEFLLINDGSTDQSEKVAKRHASKKCRIYSLPFKTGVSTARNIGINLAVAPYIAIMDSDDFSEPERFDLQLQAMESDKERVIIGTQCIQHNSHGSTRQYHPTADSDIKANLFLSNGSAMINSSTMIRTKFLYENQLFFPNTHRGEDHELWLNVMLHRGKFANLSLPLHHYYRHSQNLTKDSTLNSYNLRRRFFFKKTFLINVFPKLTGNEASALAFETTYRERRHAIKEISDRAFKKIKQVRFPPYGVSSKALLKLIEEHRREC